MSAPLYLQQKFEGNLLKSLGFAGIFFYFRYCHEDFIGDADLDILCSWRRNVDLDRCADGFMDVFVDACIYHADFAMSIIRTMVGYISLCVTVSACRRRYLGYIISG